VAKQALVVLMVVIVFGILVPIYKGFAFLDPRIIAAYACLALLFVAPASAELGMAPGNPLGRIAIIVAWGWGITLLILSTALVTLNVVNRPGGFAMPPLEFMTAVLTFSLVASIAVALLSAFLARRSSAAQAKTILRTAFLILLLALAFGSRFLPESVTLAIFDRFNTRRALTLLAWQSSVVSAVIAALLLLVLLRTRPTGPFAKIPMTENQQEGGG
jgi:hypothetical protein